MSLKMTLSSLIASAALVLASAPASASVMNFTGYAGYTTFTQDGLVMTSSDVWIYPNAGEAHMDNGIATFKLANGFDFKLNKIDLLASGGTGTARFTAYNNGTLLTTVDVSSRGNYTFGNTFSNIDEFRISYVNSHFSFDNITFAAAAAAVPEPGVLALFGLGFAGMAAMRRRRAKGSKQA